MPPDRTFARVRQIIDGAVSDYACRQALDDALERYSRRELARTRRAKLSEGRHAKQNVAALLALLSDLDEVTLQETDKTVFAEFADLFKSIATEAAAGARLMRDLEKL